MSEIHHALVLNLHQPAGNLEGEAWVERCHRDLDAAAEGLAQLEQALLTPVLLA